MDPKVFFGSAWMGALFIFRVMWSDLDDRELNIFFAVVWQMEVTGDGRVPDIGYVPEVFLYALSEGAFGFTYILFVAFAACDKVDHIACLTVTFHFDMVCVSRVCAMEPSLCR
jgi:hypothetical protein